MSGDAGDGTLKEVSILVLADRWMPNFRLWLQF